MTSSWDLVTIGAYTKDTIVTKSGTRYVNGGGTSAPTLSFRDPDDHKDVMVRLRHTLFRPRLDLALSYYASLVADSQAERGELDAAISCIDHCLSLCRDNDEHFYEPELHRRRALYEARKDPSAEGVRTSLEHAARLARRQDMPRIEVLATLDLVRRFGGIEQRRARLDELLARHPGLRELDSDPHQGGSRWAWTS